MAKIPYAGSRFQVTIGDKDPGYIKSFKGGDVSAEVSENKLGAHNVVKKHISTLKYDAAEIAIGMGMAKSTYEWIQTSWDGSYEKRPITVSIANANGEIQVEKTLYECLITEVGIPALDASSKEAGYMTLKCQPETARIAAASGKVKGSMGTNKHKQWLTSMFRIKVGDLPCDSVSKIGALTWKQTVALNDCGHLREYQQVPASVTWPELTLTISAHDVEPWLKKFKSFVIDGNNAETDEMAATLEFLHPNMKDVLGTIDFMNLGLTKLKMLDVEAGSDKLQKFEVTMYCEQMRLKAAHTDM